MRRNTSSGVVRDLSEKDLESHEDKREEELQKVSMLRRKRHFVEEYLIDFTANSNLHGLKYIGEKERTTIEKVFWLFMLICCMVLCSGFIKKVWNKYNTIPVIVTIAENPIPIWQIPFPAVTVCLETKAMQRKFNFTEYYHLYYDEDTYETLTADERNRFEDISTVCDEYVAPYTGRKFCNGSETVKYLKEDFVKLKYDEGCVKDVGKNQLTVVLAFVRDRKLAQYPISGPIFMEYIMTKTSCCASLHHEYPYLEHDSKARGWSLVDGYNGQLDPTIIYPYRGSGYGRLSGLRFILRLFDEDLDYLCKGPVQGFKILLHNPAEWPRLSNQYFRMPLSKEVTVAVKPKMMTTLDALKSYHPRSRLCYFPFERHLKYFQVYTQGNCETECLSNFTYARCGCVHFGMPRGPDMAVCSAGKVNCMVYAKMMLVTIDVDQGNERNETLIKEAREVSTSCNCLPSCTSLEYEAETSQADYDWRAIYRSYKLNITEESEGYLFARIVIFFKEAQFIRYCRSELYSDGRTDLTDFWANCGGLLGLFMGFSFLSVAEIVYFLTLRIYCMYLRRRNEKKKLETNPMKEIVIIPP